MPQLDDIISSSPPISNWAIDFKNKSFTDAPGLARKLRASIATSRDFISNFSTSPAVLPPYLTAAADSLALAMDAKTVLAFNVAITDFAITQLLTDCPRPDERLLRVAIGQHVIEQEVLELYSPTGTGSITRHERVSKELGAFFTPIEIALWMAREALAQQRTSKAKELCVLDPAMGAGIFPCAILHLFHIAPALFPSGMLNIRIRGTDINERFLKFALKFSEYIRQDLPVELDFSVTDGLADTATGFHIILMNPPYGRLKILRATHTQKNTRTRFKDEELEKVCAQERSDMLSIVARFRKDPAFGPLVQGTLEKSRLFLVRALSSLHPSGSLSIIGPDTWLSDHGSVRLRRFLRGSFGLRKIVLFKETARLFPTVNQTLAITVLVKSPQDDDESFLIFGPAKHLPTDSAEAQRTSWRSINELDPSNHSITTTSEGDLKVVAKLRKHPPLANLDWAINRRGECDLTLYKTTLSAKDTGTRLVRGDHLERFERRPPEASLKTSYINFTSFRKALGTSSKLEHIAFHRLASRQVSYIEKARRLSFASVPPKTVLANSCNYLLVAENNGATLRFPPWKHYYLLGLLNSYTLEWLFRRTSRTNHVNNADIDKFPIPNPDAPLARSIAISAAKIERLKEGGEESAQEEAFLEGLTAHLFELSGEELKTILTTFKNPDVPGILSAYSSIARHKTPNQALDSHEASPLSVLDHQIIGHIPPGGNWTSVPASIPSKRIEQIREMTKIRGGVVRTSYYGRLLEQQPSYTISTYFSRPGNGTHILPDQDRTLSTREAARLQSFPDTFKFTGSHRAKHEQVGNAVPPLLAYAVAKAFSRVLKKKNPTHIDFFAGAGGLSLGFHWAGYKLLAAQELGKDHSRTFAANFNVKHLPFSQEIKPTNKPFILQGDLTDPKLREFFFTAIKKATSKSGIDIVIGGPPCQGFSLAGHHKEADSRNDLASLYVDCIARLKPRYFLLENVEGLRFMNGGKVIRDLMAAFREAGYLLADQPWVLKAEQFGAPQMRRRVFLVGHRRGESPVALPIPRFEACRGRRERGTPELQLDLTLMRSPITIREAIADLPRLNEGESCADYTVTSQISAYGRFMRGEISVEDFFRLRAS